MHTGSAAPAFNDVLAANVLLGLHDVGVLDALSAPGGVHLDILCAQHHLNIHRTQAVFRHLLDWDIIQLERTTDSFSLSARGINFLENIGFFVWAMAGYGRLIRTAGSDMLSAEPPDWRTLRDGYSVSRGSRLCNERFIDPIFQSEFTKLGAQCVADLGCGDGHRLFSLAKDHPDLRGIGMDLDSTSIELASAKAERENVSSRLTFISKDIFQLPHPYPDVDCVICSLMMHDILGHLTCADFPAWLQKFFPSLQHIIVVDTLQPDEHIGSSTPIFINGFTLIHALMNVELHPRTAYEAALSSNGLELMSSREISGIPSTWMFIARVEKWN